ncbi:divalent-cation tolerance protein CutA [Actinacidiphila oryziradicis]|uniref:Divalent-cation tolerance protein CutA n=1 Tax=Actinacidiphila oryziradicis TaxID=2571141 RepID=A0A4U0SN55_9ACTN|nr:divalent-cation tolerance protein CutA [Actinacidiphila oryziradicis]
MQVSTTADSREAAAALARSAVKARLAASAQVLGPVASVFWHEGQYGEGEEYIAALRTMADNRRRARTDTAPCHGPGRRRNPQAPAPARAPRAEACAARPSRGRS